MWGREISIRSALVPRSGEAPRSTPRVATDTNHRRGHAIPQVTAVYTRGRCGGFMPSCLGSRDHGFDQGRRHVPPATAAVCATPDGVACAIPSIDALKVACSRTGHIGHRTLVTSNAPSGEAAAPGHRLDIKSNGGSSRRSARISRPGGGLRL